MEDKSLRDKAISQCLKLKKLAEGGEGDEKTKASNLLARKMLEFNITPEELGEALHTYQHFSYNNRREQYLLEMIICFVVADAMPLQDEKIPETYFVECNAEESLLIKKLMTFYLGCWEREEEYCFRAFIVSNNLLPKYTGGAYEGHDPKKEKGEEGFAYELKEKASEFTDKEMAKIQGLSTYITRYQFSENHLDQKPLHPPVDFFSAQF